MIQYKSKFLVCVDCNQDFLFTSGEQAYFASRQLSEPKRCQPCRKKRRDNIVPDQAARYDR